MPIASSVVTPPCPPELVVHPTSSPSNQIPRHNNSHGPEDGLDQSPPPLSTPSSSAISSVVSSAVSNAISSVVSSVVSNPISTLVPVEGGGENEEHHTEEYQTLHPPPPAHAPPVQSASLSSNNDTPLVSDASESQLQVPAPDFAFYEWDFRDDSFPGDSEGQPQATREASKAPNGLAVGFAGLGTMPLGSNDSFEIKKNEMSLSRASIEELMRPSMDKSRLTRELGPALAAELHADLFGGVRGDVLSDSRSSGQIGSDTHQDGGGQQQQVPEDIGRRRRIGRRYTLDVIPSFDREACHEGAEGAAETAENRRRRRSHTVGYSREGEELDDSSRIRQRSVEGERGTGGGFLKLFTRLGSSTRKRKLSQD